MKWGIFAVKSLLEISASCSAVRSDGGGWGGARMVMAAAWWANASSRRLAYTRFRAPTGGRCGGAAGASAASGGGSVWPVASSAVVLAKGSFFCSCRVWGWIFGVVRQTVRCGRRLADLGRCQVRCVVPITRKRVIRF